MSQGEKPAYQNRSRETRDKIVQALDDALREKPFDQVSVAEIASRAGIAVGTVYRRFENKDALIPVILEIYRMRLEDGIAGEGQIEVAPDDSLRDVLRIVMAKAWSTLKKEAHLLRAVHLHVRLQPDLINDDSWDAYEAASYGAIESLFSMYAEQIKQPDIKRCSAITAYLMNTAFLEKGLYPDESPAQGLDHSGEELAEAVADMVYAWLQLEN